MTNQQIDLVINLLKRTAEEDKRYIGDELLSDVIRSSVKDEAEACNAAIEILEVLKK